MNTIDWTTYNFHCSSIAQMMVKPRAAGELLSATTKSYLKELWIKETFQRDKIDMIGNKYTTKGTIVETDSIELYEHVSSVSYFKNNEQLKNDYLVGTPDIVAPNLIDIKSSWDIFTFGAVDEKKARADYYWQPLCH